MVQPGQLAGRAEGQAVSDWIVALMLQWEELEEPGTNHGRLNGYQILRDRELAMLLSWELNGGEVGEHQGLEARGHQDDHDYQDYHGPYGNEEDRADDAAAETSVVETGDPDPMAEAHLERLRCVGCYEDTHPGASLRTPCNHVYCTDCLTQLFERSMAEETLFPPRCCMQAILLTEAADVLQPAVAEEFAARFVELSTANRTYCFEPTCATFIPPDAIRGDIAVCPTCVRITCAMCKQASHAGRDCPRDEALQQLLETAQEEGWRRCGNCSRVIELNYVAIAATTSATSAAYAGRPAPAFSGRRSASSIARPSSLIACLRPDRLPSGAAIVIDGDATIVWSLGTRSHRVVGMPPGQC
ncbi:hypothetical protein LTR53_002079 [Teratosphaeriaceae sp. CCFEE 6253]|nr:hypothetical protein LTR53_002079 [Teratosphaeriaceae sp. CCFEE 6253]